MPVPDVRDVITNPTALRAAVKQALEARVRMHVENHVGAPFDVLYDMAVRNMELQIHELIAEVEDEVRLSVYDAHGNS